MDLGAEGEDNLPGIGEGALVRLFEAAGLSDVEGTEMWARRRFDTFDEWWAPFEEGVGPAGRYLAALDEPRRQAVREAARALIPRRRSRSPAAP